MNQTAGGFRPPTSSPPMHRDEHPGDHHRDDNHQRAQDQRDYLSVVRTEPAPKDSEDLHSRTPFRGSVLACILRTRGATDRRISTHLDDRNHQSRPGKLWQYSPPTSPRSSAGGRRARMRRLVDCDRLTSAGIPRRRS
jgi:hypothetical protein